MVTVVTIGPVLFDGFEVPEKVPFGGEQELVVKKLPGGKRIINPMGPIESDISWSGRFRGSAAETRAQLLDYLRKQGQVLDLAWSTFRRKVIISSFKGDFLDPFEIPYQISVIVTEDDTSALLNTFFSVQTVIGEDLNTAIQVAATLNLPGVSAAIQGIADATATVDTLAGVTAADAAAVGSAIGIAQDAVSTAMTAANSITTATGSVAGMVAGSDPASLASGLISQATSFTNLGDLSTIQSSLGRMATNLSNAVT